MRNTPDTNARTQSQRSGFTYKGVNLSIQFVAFKRCKSVIFVPGRNMKVAPVFVCNFSAVLRGCLVMRVTLCRCDKAFRNNQYNDF